MPAKILIIEDNAANLELMVYLLHAFGYTPYTAEDGETGLATVQERAQAGEPAFDLVICDVHLPGINGEEVVAHLRALDDYRATPILAVTALAMVGDRERILESGFSAHISKPIDPESFVDQVERFLPPRERNPRVVYPDNINNDFVPKTNGGPHFSRILVVDDTPSNIDFVRATLEPFGYGIHSADSVTDALAYVEEFEDPPHMVLCDLHMHPRGGREFLELVPSLPKLAGVPVVIISSTFTTEEDCTDCLLRGARLFIRRPIEPEALLAEINRILRPVDA